VRKWISSAIRHPGALHRQLGVPRGQKIPIARLRWAARQPGTLGRRARLAMTLRTLQGDDAGPSCLDRYLLPAPRVRVDPSELEQGIRDELEHTPSRAVARRIALHHLAKDRHYYTRRAMLGL